VLLHLVGSVCRIVHTDAFGDRNVDALFFMLRWDRYRFNKNRPRTCYAKYVFVHPVGPVDHVVHFGAYRA
jgi:hypothetical protein